MKLLISTLFLVLMFGLQARGDYYFQAQIAVQEAGKTYDATGICQIHPKDFGTMAIFFKQTGEKGDSKCQILNDTKQVVCKTLLNGSLFSTNTTYWFSTKNDCEKARADVVASKESLDNKDRIFFIYSRDYKYKDGYGNIVGASKDCRQIKSAVVHLKHAIEIIASEEGFLNKGQSCKDGAFPAEYSCKKSEATSREYAYFESNESCANKLNQLRQNYNLK